MFTTAVIYQNILSITTYYNRDSIFIMDHNNLQIVIIFKKNFNLALILIFDYS